LWDRQRRRLVLVRDRVGIRPLFHATQPDGTVLFGSEMKALFAHGALRPEIDPVALGQVATLWVSVPPRTAFKGVEELGPGRMLVIEETRRTERQYWRHQFPRENEYEEKSASYWAREIRELLYDAVRLQLRADVPVGTYLSGGLDSSILTALVKQQHENELMTFSVGFSDARFDEREYQRQVTSHLQTTHRHLEVDSASIGRDFTEVVWFAERPLLRTAPAPLLRLAGLVRDSSMKVVLTGEGADELFAGYNLFRENKVRRFWAQSPDSAWRPRLLSKLYGYVQRDAKTEQFWQRFFAKDLQNTADPYYSHRIRWSNTEQTKRFIAPELRAAMQSEEALIADLESYLEPERSHWHPLCRAQYLELTLFMSCYLLSSQGDRMAMGRSVEGRVPFLDHRVVELAARVPPKFKLRGLNEKYILKQAFADLLPPAIATRPKQPYRAPISSCFSAQSSNLGASLLRANELERIGLTDVAAVSKLLKKSASNASALSEREEMGIALVTSLQLLHHLFVDHFEPSTKEAA
jgi:asparagine synthase (glutamine-hydrolysing)